MTQPQWEKVQLTSQAGGDLPPFLKWGDLAGQIITVAVLEFTADGGRDFDGNPCPRLDMVVAQPGGYNIAEGHQVPLNSGDKLTWQGNTPARLANGLKAANPAPGDLLQLSHEGTYRTEKGTGKDIQVQIARGAGLQFLESFFSAPVPPQPPVVQPFPVAPQGSPPF